MFTTLETASPALRSNLDSLGSDPKPKQVQEVLKQHNVLDFFGFGRQFVGVESQRISRSGKVTRSVTYTSKKIKSAAPAPLPEENKELRPLTPVPLPVTPDDVVDNGEFVTLSPEPSLNTSDENDFLCQTCFRLSSGPCPFCLELTCSECSDKCNLCGQWTHAICSQVGQCLTPGCGITIATCGDVSCDGNTGFCDKCNAYCSAHIAIASAMSPQRPPSPCPVIPDSIHDDPVPVTEIEMPMDVPTPVDIEMPVDDPVDVPMDVPTPVEIEIPMVHAPYASESDHSGNVSETEPEDDAMEVDIPAPAKVETKKNKKKRKRSDSPTEEKTKKKRKIRPYLGKAQIVKCVVQYMKAAKKRVRHGGARKFAAFLLPKIKELLGGKTIYLENLADGELLSYVEAGIVSWNSASPAELDELHQTFSLEPFRPHRSFVPSPVPVAVSSAPAPPTVSVLSVPVVPSSSSTSIQIIPDSDDEEEEEKPTVHLDKQRELVIKIFAYYLDNPHKAEKFSFSCYHHDNTIRVSFLMHYVAAMANGKGVDLDTWSLKDLKAAVCLCLEPTKNAPTLDVARLF